MDILTLAELDAWLADAARAPAAIFGLAIVSRKAAISAVDLKGSALLDCEIDAEIFSQINGQGGSVVTAARDLPFRSTRTALYSVEDLYDLYDPADSIGSWKRSFDYGCYRWFMNETEQLPKLLGTADTINARLHDTAIEGAVGRFIAGVGRPVVGFMGGHDTPRDAPIFATVAALARRLTREGLLVLTGGGPGLMEAANLGAFLAPYSDECLEQALDVLGKAPRYDHADWLRAGWVVRQQLLTGEAYLKGSISLGIPTWLYGFEPPNVFATHHAKMFYNSLREDGLVTLAGAGLVIGPGNAGTVQEVFQDATQNYYRKKGTAPTPIALLGADFWDRPPDQGPDTTARTKPLKPLLKALAGEKPSSDWSSAALVTDDVDAVASLILSSAKSGGLLTRGEQARRKLR